MVGQLLTAGFSAFGDVMQGQEQAGIAKANEHNEIQNANTAEVTAKANAGLKENSNERRYGEARAALSASGVDANTGSPLAIMHDVVTQGSLSQQLIKYQGQNAARTDLGKAALDKAEASDDLTAGWIKGATTVMTTGDDVAREYAGGGG